MQMLSEDAAEKVKTREKDLCKEMNPYSKSLHIKYSFLKRS